MNILKIILIGWQLKEKELGHIERRMREVQDLHKQLEGQMTKLRNQKVRLCSPPGAASLHCLCRYD